MARRIKVDPPPPRQGGSPSTHPHTFPTSIPHTYRGTHTRTRTHAYTYTHTCMRHLTLKIARLAGARGRAGQTLTGFPHLRRSSSRSLAGPVAPRRALLTIGGAPHGERSCSPMTHVGGGAADVTAPRSSVLDRRAILRPSAAIGFPVGVELPTEAIDRDCH